MSALVSLSRIVDSPWQTRLSYDEARVDDLAADISRNGLLQPPVGRIVDGVGEVLPLGTMDLATPKAVEDLLKEDVERRVQLAFGHNRLRAMRKLRRGVQGATMRVELRYLTDEDMARLAWSENDKRKDLTAIEEARAIERRMKDFGWTQAQVAAELGLGRSTVANKLRLLKLPSAVQERVASGEISERQAQALLGCVDLAPEEEALLPFMSGALHASGDEWRREIIRHAAEGDSSDQIRSRVQQFRRVLDRYAATARHIPPRLYVTSADLQRLGNTLQRGIIYGTNGRDSTCWAHAEITGGLLGKEKGSPQKVLFMATGRTSTQAAETVMGYELLTPEAFRGRGKSEGGHGVEIKEAHGYGKPVLLRVGAKEVPMIVGYQLEVYETDDPAQASHIGIVQTKRSSSSSGGAAKREPDTPKPEPLPEPAASASAPALAEPPATESGHDEGHFEATYNRLYSMLISDSTRHNVRAMEVAWEDATRAAAEADAAGSTRHGELLSLATRIKARLDYLRSEAESEAEAEPADAPAESGGPISRQEVLGDITQAVFDAIPAEGPLLRLILFIGSPKLREEPPMLLNDALHAVVDACAETALQIATAEQVAAGGIDYAAARARVLAWLSEPFHATEQEARRAKRAAA